MNSLPRLNQALDSIGFAAVDERDVTDGLRVIEMEVIFEGALDEVVTWAPESDEAVQAIVEWTCEDCVREHGFQNDDENAQNLGWSVEVYETDDETGQRHDEPFISWSDRNWVSPMKSRFTPA